jgi:hypothetical protein
LSRWREPTTASAWAEPETWIQIRKRVGDEAWGRRQRASETLASSAERWRRSTRNADAALAQPTAGTDARDARSGLVPEMTKLRRWKLRSTRLVVGRVC